MDSIFELIEREGQQKEERLFAEVVLPLALPKLYTYGVPLHFKEQVKIGIRVEVQFGRSRHYAALVHNLHNKTPEGYSPKPILDVLDETPIVTAKQFELWAWLARYYNATMGEVMNAALPAGLKLNSETRILLHPNFDPEQGLELDVKEDLICQALEAQQELSMDQVRQLLKQKTVYPIIKRLLSAQVIVQKEELKERYKPRMEQYVRLAEPYRSDSSQLKYAFEEISDRASRQLETFMALVQLQREQGRTTRSALYKRANTDASVLKRLEEKGLVELFEEEVSRLDAYEEETEAAFALSPAQEQALQAIKTELQKQQCVLLHGVTGSGKTQLFVQLMEETIAAGKQVLYLLPEIALTAQIVGRLQRHFGDKIAVYHSKFNQQERVEIWQQSMEGIPILLGARSALFLPFQNLGLIVVDEEHDPSYKQHDPAPRYNARDTAVFLAHLYRAKALLGTATPSLETFENVRKKKYGLVRLTERYGGLQLPEVQVVDILAQKKAKSMKSHFSQPLLDALQQCLDNGEQAILFQNRRGYAPSMRCDTCGWHAECTNCDVSLTFHKYATQLRCHYCGYTQAPPKTCPACGSQQLTTRQFGTEKIAEELQIFFPDAKILRMDLDTVRGKNGHDKIIQRFEAGDVDMLVGTQMVTKGLDFDNVGLVGVLDANQMLQFPDFRASERSFQLLTQVSGRAGRKKKRGRVIIQSYRTDHPVLQEVVDYNMPDFVERELQERQRFKYPPYVRLIRIQLKHKKKGPLQLAGQFVADRLRSRLGHRVLGPAEPGVSRIRNYYLLDILLKLETHNSKQLNHSKDLLWDVQEQLKMQKGLSGIRMVVDVDPY